MSDRLLPRILVADDEEIQRNILREILIVAGHEVATASSIEEALAQFERGMKRDLPFEIVLTDLKMPGDQEGLDLLAAVKERRPESAVILMTAYSTVASAVRAMKLGALDYLPKPFDKAQLLATVEQATEKLQLRRENRRLRDALCEGQGVRRMIGRSARMRELAHLIERLAPSESNCLIRGESGTGKELVARALHYGGPRAGEPFIAINCAAIPETLIESELFGHEKGTFTGASQAKSGRFEEVGRGTLFLDEIGSMKTDLQAKLLRVIQEREFSRVGTAELIPFRARVVAATARDLEEAIARQEFREDLYFRLNVVTLEIPPLRERRDDIPELVEHFLGRCIERVRPGATLRLTVDAASALVAYDWPGNVRELENCIERMVVLAEGPDLDVDLLPPSIRRGESSLRRTGGSTGEPVRPDRNCSVLQLPAAGVVLEEVEANLIRQALARSGGKLEPAAQLLGITYKTLQYRIKKYDLRASGSRVGAAQESAAPGRAARETAPSGREAGEDVT